MPCLKHLNFLTKSSQRGLAEMSTFEDSMSRDGLRRSAAAPSPRVSSVGTEAQSSPSNVKGGILQWLGGRRRGRGARLGSLAARSAPSQTFPSQVRHHFKLTDLRLNL